MKVDARDVHDVLVAADVFVAVGMVEVGPKYFIIVIVLVDISANVATYQELRLLL